MIARWSVAPLGSSAKEKKERKKESLSYLLLPWTVANWATEGRLRMINVCMKSSKELS